MKILIYLRYFFRSVFLRGFINTIRFLLAEVRYERKFKIQTSAIKNSDSKEFYHYQGSGYLVLLQLFKEMAKTTGSFQFIDIGCGKGRALLVAEYCGYNHITGIELDKELLKDAEINLKTYAFKRTDSTIELVHANALDYQYPDRATVFFMFNPFNEEVMAKVLDRILNGTEHEVWFIYMNPLYPQPFLSKRLDLVKTYKVGRYTEALVYRRAALSL